MVVIDIRPIRRGVTIGALSRMVILGCQLAVTAGAVTKAGVVKGDVRPICAVVTIGALFAIMIVGGVF